MVTSRFLVEPLFRPFAEELLNRAGLRPPDRLLDVARGTGVVARLAQRVIRNPGLVVGIDDSPGMLAVARSVAPTIEWREGDAARLLFANDNSFDVGHVSSGIAVLPRQACRVAGNASPAVRTAQRDGGGRHGCGSEDDER